MPDYPSTQQLWAPWRMEFIRAPRESGCFLCRIAGGTPDQDEDNLVIHRNGGMMLLLNRYPYNSGHLMVAPCRHVATLGELTGEERRALLDMACLGEQLLQAVVNPDGFNMGINQGSAAGAGLKEHLHWHVVPRWEGDTNFMPVLGRVRVMPQALSEMQAALREALSRRGEVG
ncbi:MAG TPA: HIT domain-containing protein [Kiritimatiellia bacterium]|nr:HIT domain-containing protein [Kiritimatiellia bacterium]